MFEENSTSNGQIAILDEVLAFQQEIFEHRRWFHAHPELSFQEIQTAAKVVELLRNIGIDEIWEGVGRTGVVALIRGGKPGKCVALRADMDALPIQETSDLPFRSQNDGAMHACGHDGHMAGLLAAAKVLYAERELLSGVVKLIFQPAEEGYSGAPEMIKDGCLEDGPMGPNVDEIYGLHLWSFIPLGEIGCKDGPVMAFSDKFSIDVKGVGGHGAHPQGTVDAVVEAAALVTALQTVISRNKDPLQSGVLTCGTINGGYAPNIIADHVNISGTTRAFSTDVQDMIKSRMGDICCGVAKTYGGDIDFKYEYGYPPVVNSFPDCVRIVQTAAEKIVGTPRSRVPIVTMGAEDFSFFLQQRPGCFFFVGCALPGDIRPHHKSVFDFDERGVLVSASVFVQIIRDILR